jgi:hypothetical protein
MEYARGRGRLRIPYLDYHFVDSLQFCEEMMQRTLARVPSKRPTAEKLIRYIDEFAEHLAYEKPKDRQISARPLHATYGGIHFPPESVTPPRSGIYGNERQTAHSVFNNSESADEWSDEEWEGPTQMSEGDSAPRANRYANFQCEECRRDNRNVRAPPTSGAHLHLVRV